MWTTLLPYPPRDGDPVVTSSPESPSLAALLPCVWLMFVHRLSIQAPTLLLNHRRKPSNSSGISMFGSPVFYTIYGHWNRISDKRFLSNVFSGPVTAHFPRLRTNACEQAERVRRGRKGWEEVQTLWGGRGQSTLLSWLLTPRTSLKGLSPQNSTQSPRLGAPFTPDTGQERITGFL